MANALFAAARLSHAHGRVRTAERAGRTAALCLHTGQGTKALRGMRAEDREPPARAQAGVPRTTNTDGGMTHRRAV